ncbi:hypothetical protein FB451DRAFT_1486924 [Mycena latifolia]|nr:hypothetical protein FB451DRAFT_1486924 [Mycena latifolia]
MKNARDNRRDPREKGQKRQQEARYFKERGCRDEVRVGRDPRRHSRKHGLLNHSTQRTERGREAKYSTDVGTKYLTYVAGIHGERKIDTLPRLGSARRIRAIINREADAEAKGFGRGWGHGWGSQVAMKAKGSEHLEWTLLVGWLFIIDLRAFGYHPSHSRRIPNVVIVLPDLEQQVSRVNERDISIRSLPWHFSASTPSPSTHSSSNKRRARTAARRLDACAHPEPIRRGRPTGDTVERVWESDARRGHRCGARVVPLASSTSSNAAAKKSKAKSGDCHNANAKSASKANDSVTTKGGGASSKTSLLDKAVRYLLDGDAAPNRSAEESWLMGVRLPGWGCEDEERVAAAAGGKAASKSSNGTGKPGVDTAPGTELAASPEAGPWPAAFHTAFYAREDPLLLSRRKRLKRYSRMRRVSSPRRRCPPVPVESDVPPAPSEQAASPVTVQLPSPAWGSAASLSPEAHAGSSCARTIPHSRRRPCTSSGLQGFVQGVAGAEEARASGGGGCVEIANAVLLVVAPAVAPIVMLDELQPKAKVTGNEHLSLLAVPSLVESRAPSPRLANGNKREGSPLALNAVAFPAVLAPQSPPRSTLHSPPQSVLHSSKAPRYPSLSFPSNGVQRFHHLSYQSSLPTSTARRATGLSKPRFGRPPSPPPPRLPSPAPF